MSASEAASVTVSARHFDGRSARAHSVCLRFSATGVVVEGEAGEWPLPAGEFSVSEALGATPRSLTLADGQSFEVGDVAALARGLRLLGRREAAVTRWQQSWRGVCAALAATVLLVDDVMTSGATLGGCADALLAAGAARVDVVVMCRVAKEG